MKRYHFGRVVGILLAGILTLESSIPVFATEIPTETARIETSQETECEETVETEMTEASSDKEKETQTTKETDEAEETTETVETEEETETTTTEEAETEENFEVMALKHKPAQSAPTEAPSNLSVVERTANTTTILWPTIDGYTAYEVHRSNNENTGFSLLERIETTSNVGAFLDSSCESGKVYYYKVRAVVTADGEITDEGPFSSTIDNSVVLQQIVLSKQEIEMNNGTEQMLSITYAPSYASGMYNASWSSDNEKVVTVADGKVKAVGVGTATITATAGDKTASCKVTVKVPLEQIVLDKTEVEIAKDKKVQLVASLYPQDTMEVLSWSSSDEKVVTVTPNETDGKCAELTAIGAGTAVITVTAGEISAQCKVMVSIPATDVELSSDTVQLLEKDDSVTVAINVEPINTTDEVSYVIDDPELVQGELYDRVLTISSLGKLGATQVHITVGKQTTVLNVQVVEEKQDDDIVSNVIPVSSISLTAKWTKKAANEGENDKETKEVPVKLWLGEESYSKATVSAKISPANATNQQITWSSSDESVVTVDENGAVNAVGIGSASIIATADNGITGKVQVVVVPQDGGFSINGNKKITLYCNEKLPELAIQKGAKTTHQISVLPEVACQYHSSNEEIASVDNAGLVTAHKPGTAVISAIGKSNGDVQTVHVTVKRIVESVELPLDEIKVMADTQPQLTFKLYPADASAESLNSIKITSSDTECIRVDSYEVKDKNNGIVKLSAIKGKIDEETKKNIPITVTIKAGDTYYDDVLKRNVTITSVEQTIQVYVESETNVATSIKISGKNKMQSGTSQLLDTIVKDRYGNEQNTSLLPIGFTSSDTEVATVDKNGMVTALKGGKATITAFVMNGSNVKVDYAITIEQRPEEIVFDRPVYGVSKNANQSATVAVQPGFFPTTTVNKNVAWSVAQVLSPEGTQIEGAISDYFTVDAGGRVTAKAKATEGMRAVITCTSKAYAADEEQVVGTVIVEVQPKKVTAVRFNQTTTEAVGLKEHSLAFTTTFAKGYAEATYEAFTSDAEIAAVKEIKNGQVILNAYKYGTVTVTLCADKSVLATCKVTVYPVARGSLAAKQTSYLLQQTQYNGSDRVQLQFVDTKTKKVIDSTLFTYQSSNSDIVYVDENGVAYANAVSNGKITSKNNQITVTATLKDDPDKRKVTTKVIVCPTEQVERMDVAYYSTRNQANQDTDNTKGTILTDNGATMGFSKSGQQFVLRTIAYGVNNDRIADAKVTYTSSDTSLATVTSQTRLTYKDGAEIYQVWEAVITVKKAGRFSIHVASQDQKKYARDIDFVVYSAKPVLESSDLGSINRNSTIVEVTDQEGPKKSLASDKTFKVLATDGTEITSVTVQSAKVKVKASNQIETIPSKKFAVREVGNNEYRLYMLASEMEKVVDGTYSITLKVQRTLLKNEDDDPGYVENPETTTITFDAAFKIVSTLPRLDAARITINTFIKEDMVQIPIKTTETIEEVSIDSKGVLANELKIVKKGKDWYARIQNDAFENWKKTSTQGVLKVKLEGYEKPVSMNLNVSCQSKKPVVKQAVVPSILLQYGAETYTTLIDDKKNEWKDYTVERKSSTVAPVFTVKSENDNQVKITFADPSMKLRGQGVTLSEKVLVKKEEWREPIELTISVKAYNDTNLPTVGFEKTTININKSAAEDSAETKIKTNYNNLVLKEGEWSISDTCTYKTVVNKQTIWHKASDAFKVEYEDGVVKVSLRNQEVPNGTYKLTMTNVWDRDTEGVKPLTTATLTVVVKGVEPKVTIRMSGQLDLIRRSQSTLMGTITVSDTNSTVKRIRLVNTNNDGFADKFYCTKKDNTFTIYARSNAVLTTAQITGFVEIELSNGKVLNTKLSFAPRQSVPTVITPANKTIYKSTSLKTVDYNFNEKLASGVRIADIEAVNVPSGLKVQDNNGHLYVTLANKTLKSGKYKIDVDVYFKGAQAEKTNEKGKAVRKTIYVEVKE